MSKSAPPMHVALLRGVNVGGKNRLPMADLAAMFTKAGGRDVATYIQSGNVVFRAAPAASARVSQAVSRAISQSFGFTVPLVIRTAEEMLAASRENPFLAAGADPETLHLGFLADLPAAAGVASLDDNRSPPDRFLVRGRDIYFHFPNGLARSKLTNAYFDSRLSTTTTVRNWRTVLALVEMANR